MRHTIFLSSCLLTLHLFGLVIPTHEVRSEFSPPMVALGDKGLGFRVPMQVSLPHNFHAQGIIGAIVVEWKTSDEQGCAGFNLWRSLHPSQEQTRVNNEAIAPMGVGHTYRITDTDIVPWRSYWYQLEILLEGGDSIHSGFIAAQPQAELCHFIYLPVEQKGSLSGLSLPGSDSQVLSDLLADTHTVTEIYARGWNLRTPCAIRTRALRPTCLIAAPPLMLSPARITCTFMNHRRKR